MSTTEQTIFKLPQEVINKIAAGEVINKPLNAVKELLENSIDSGATQISIFTRGGGYKMIHIKDNGSGINV